MSEAELPLGFSRMNRFRQSLPLSRSASQTKLRSPGTARLVHPPPGHGPLLLLGSLWNPLHHSSSPSTNPWLPSSTSFPPPCPPPPPAVSSPWGLSLHSFSSQPSSLLPLPSLSSPCPIPFSPGLLSPSLLSAASPSCSPLSPSQRLPLFLPLLLLSPVPFPRPGSYLLGVEEVP